MAEPKTRPTDTDVDEFLDSVADDRRREDVRTVVRLMEDVTGEPPVVWGTSIVGFGEVASGAAGTPWPVVALAPRKNELVLYLSTALTDADFEGLGPHRRGKACLYIKKVDALDQARLRTLVERSVELAQA